MFTSHQTVFTRGAVIGPMRKHALHFVNICLYLTLPFSDYIPRSFLTNVLCHRAPMISAVSTLNELLPIPVTQRCHVPCFTILCQHHKIPHT